MGKESEYLKSGEHAVDWKASRREWFAAISRGQQIHQRRKHSGAIYKSCDLTPHATKPRWPPTSTSFDFGHKSVAVQFPDSEVERLSMKRLYQEKSGDYSY